mmetsp:Transcript_44064/g.102917  ORF Transcript_44064/g.102917 Transcript_44064/m.102917 type:complete len:268 (-) Transcript_44064:5388-6191(-)
MIMLQSLAPSPIARVMAFSSCLMRRTTAPFCLGDTRQQITVVHVRQMATKSFSFCGSSASSRHLPSMTMPSSICFCAKACRACSATSCNFACMSAGWNCPPFSKSPEENMGRSPGFASAARSPVATPILMAVSVLSPVSIQTLMPACVILMMVSETSSCRRSSMPLTPFMTKLTSSLSETSSIFCSRFCVAKEASCHSWRKVSTSSCVRSRLARQSVRSPSSANSRSVSWDCFVSVVWRCSGAMRSIMIESAPLQKRTSRSAPEGSL